MDERHRQRGGANGNIMFLCAASLALVSCVSWILEKPTFMLRGIVISPRSFTELSLLVGLEVQNPNRLDLTLTSFECTMYLRNEVAGKGRLLKELLMPAASTTPMEIPIEVKLKDLGRGLKAILTGGDLPYKIEGSANVKTVFGSLNYPFSKEGTTNLGRLF